jgi:superfamily II DNA or RNA helicase
MAKQLRPYQTKLLNDVNHGLAKHKKIIACMATGGGKTVVFTTITNMAISKGKTVLLLTESRKIFTQISNENKSISINAGVKFIEVVPNIVYCAMAQTLANRDFIISQFYNLSSNLIVIYDECHCGVATKLLKQLPNALLIGFTATPDYRVAKHLPLLYKDIVVGAQPQELLEGGFLAPYYHYERQSADIANLKKDSKGEFTEASQFEAFEKQQVFAGLHEDLKKFHTHKTLIFCSSIKHCATLSNELRSVGYELSEVHSQNSQSDIELSNFMNGNIGICVSVGILTKGFDFVPINLIILQRATTSLALYMQMVGRGSRISPQTNKTRFTVLDYGGNASRHGLWNFEFDWANMWNKPPKKKKDGIAPIKECPKCFLILAPRVMTCPECGHIFEAKEKKYVEGTMVEVTAQYNFLRGKYISELTAEELAQYAKITNKKPFAIRVAKAKQDKVFLQAFAKDMGYHSGWVSHQDISEPLEFFNIKIR